MLEIWKLLSFHFLLVKFVKICWLAYLLVGNIGAITTRDLGRDKFGIRALGSSVSRVQEQCLVESCGSV